jgi:hypothetical protein
MDSGFAGFARAPELVFVIAGLDPAIHEDARDELAPVMDHRVKPGGDEIESASFATAKSAAHARASGHPVKTECCLEAAAGFPLSRE